MSSLLIWVSFDNSSTNTQKTYAVIIVWDNLGIRLHQGLFLYHLLLIKLNSNVSYAAVLTKFARFLASFTKQTYLTTSY